MKRTVEGLGSCFPQHYAAASLKPGFLSLEIAGIHGFPQHYAAASLKRFFKPYPYQLKFMFSAALRCGLIEARGTYCTAGGLGRSFSAALRCGLIEAINPDRMKDHESKFSAALRCGLIEARPRGPLRPAGSAFSAALRCGLIEARLSSYSLLCG